MKHEQALKIAEKVKALLSPHCERIEIAGSIRRKKPEVKVLKEPIIIVDMLTCKKCKKSTYRLINRLCQECYDQLTE